MESSLRHRVGPIALVVTAGIGLALVATIDAVSALFSKPDTISSSQGTSRIKYPSPSFSPKVEAENLEATTEFSCYDPNLLPVWLELKKDKTFKAWTDGRGKLDCSELLEVNRSDLNRDGNDEFLVRGKTSQMCSAVGNCAFWIVAKRNGKTRVLLASSDYRDGYDRLDLLQRSRNHGYPDIILKGHFSASETAYTTWSYTGEKYVEKRCMYEVPRSGRGEGSWELITCKQFYAEIQNETAE